MRLSPFIALIPALFLLNACGSSPPGGTAATDTEAGSSGSTSGSSATSSNTSAGACVPGQSVACMCIDGNMGAQECNAAGTGFDPCMCTGGSGATSTSTSTSTTDAMTSTSTSTTDVTASGGISSSGDGSSGGMSSGGMSSSGSTGGGGGALYGPCPDGDADCEQGEMCISGQGMQGQGMWHICTSGQCQDNADCDTDVCADAPGDGMLQPFCLPQTCSQQNPCPMGMTCFPGFMNNPAVCLWQ